MNFDLKTISDILFYL